MWIWFPTLSFFPLIAAACISAPYEYEPVRDVAPLSEGKRYDIPATEPSGALHVNTYGIADLINGNDASPDVRALHVRVTLLNTREGNDSAWIFNIRNQTIEIPNQGNSRAAYVNSKMVTLPALTIEPDSEVRVDLYFPLPKGYHSVEQIPYFIFHWVVQAGEQSVSRSTRFEKSQIQPEIIALRPNEPYPFDDDFGLGWGPYWWYDLTYPDFAFPRAVIHPSILN